MFASKFFFVFLISTFILAVSCGTKVFDIFIPVSCGNLKVTGEVEFCAPATIPGSKGQQLAKWSISRGNITHRKSYEYMNGYYNVYLRSDCGVLTTKGSYCVNQYTFSMNVRNQKSPVQLHNRPVNLLKEVDGSESRTSMELKCDKDLQSSICN